MRNKIVNELAEKLLAKEQECKELREDKIYTDMACEQLEKENNQLKAEKEELKKEFFSFMNGDYCANGCSLKQQLYQLKVELKAEKNKIFLPTCYEQLYKEAKEMNNDIAKKCFDLEKENKQLKADNEQLKKNYFTVIQQRNKAEQTLTEIKNILKRCMKRIPLFEMKAIANDINEILKKIKEVENV